MSEEVKMQRSLKAAFLFGMPPDKIHTERSIITAAVLLTHDQS